MASELLKQRFEEYQYHIKNPEIEEKVLQAMIQAERVALAEGDIEFGIKVKTATIENLNRIVERVTNGGNIAMLEDFAQKNKQEYPYINWYYDSLLVMARDDLDAFWLYLERDRKREERFYEPRRKTLLPITDAFMDAEYHRVNEIFLHQPPRTGKSQDTTGAVAWHCGRNTELSNLYVTHNNDLGGAFVDGVEEIMFDPTYRYHDIFPEIKIADKDAQAHEIDFGRKKKYKSLSGKGLEAGLSGKYDANGWLINDDLLEGIQDVVSPDVLKRKRNIYQNNVLSRAKESCVIINVGTIWATKDIFMKRREDLETLPEHKDRKVITIILPALDPDTDESNFDYDYGVGYSTAAYRAKRAEFEANDDMAGWWSQYQQQPIDRQGAVFNPAHMRYYKDLPDEEPLKIIAHGDTALGGGDFVSFPIVYVYEDGRMYCEDVVFDNSEKHVTEPQIVAKIKQHRIKNAHFESNQGGEGYKDDIVRQIRNDEEITWRVNITSDWAPSDKRKAQRIFDHAQGIREIYFKDPQHRHEQYRKFMNNLFSFTLNMSKKQNDDAPDSLAGLLDFEENGSGVAVARITSGLF